MSKRRDLAVRLLLDPPCPECGAYEGKLMLRNGAEAVAFLNCQNFVCRRDLFWENAKLEKKLVCRKRATTTLPIP